jgi:hypothetical protein
MADKTPTLHDPIECAKQLDAFDKLRLADELIRDVKATVEQTPPAPLKSVYGAVADLGPAPSAEDIGHTRREMFQTFPRDEIA